MTYYYDYPLRHPIRKEKNSAHLRVLANEGFQLLFLQREHGEQKQVFQRRWVIPMLYEFTLTSHSSSNLASQWTTFDHDLPWTSWSQFMDQSPMADDLQAWWTPIYTGCFSLNRDWQMCEWYWIYSSIFYLRCFLCKLWFLSITLNKQK